jgi:hypothetical protein
MSRAKRALKSYIKKLRCFKIESIFNALEIVTESSNWVHFGIWGFIAGIRPINSGFANKKPMGWALSADIGFQV